MTAARLARRWALALLTLGPFWPATSHGAPAVTTSPPRAVTTGASGPTVEVKAQAAALYKEGAGLFREGRFREAADRFQAAYNLDPSPILLYNLARAAEELGDAGAAVGHYKAYLARYPQAEDRAEVERRIRVLEAVSKTVVPGSLGLSGVPEGAAVTFNDAAPPAVGPDGRYSLPPGRYSVKITLAGAPPEERVVEIRSNERAEAAFGVDAPPIEAREGDRPYRLWGWIATGVGVAVAGVGTYFYLDSFAAADDFKMYGKKVDALDPGSPTYARELDRYDSKSRDAEDRMNTDLLLGRVLLGVGAVAAAGGVTLLVLDATGGGQSSAPRAQLVPLPGGLGISGRF